MKRVPKGQKHFWYQPSSQNVSICTFLGFMANDFGWNWSAEYFSGFDGCLNGVLEETYKKRYDKFVRFLGSTKFILFFIFLIYFSNFDRENLVMQSRTIIVV